MCQEFCAQGGVPGQVPPTPQTRYTPLGPGTPPHQVHPPDQVYPLTRYTPWDQVCPRPGTPPGTRYTPQTRYTPLGPGTPTDQVHPLGPGTPPRPGTPRSSACWEIQATSGWYASCWNVFSFMTYFHRARGAWPPRPSPLDPLLILKAMAMLDEFYSCVSTPSTPFQGGCQVRGSPLVMKKMLRQRITTFAMKLLTECMTLLP